MDGFLDQISEDFAASLGDASPLSKVPAVTCMIEGPLLPEDIQQYLGAEGQLQSAQKADTKDLAVLRAKHHSVARLLAEGVPEGVVATITGYTAGYISVLKAAPAMAELIEHYRQPGNLAAREIGENLRRVGSMALERLEERIEKDAVDDNVLLSAAKLGMDRSGHGPASTSLNVTEHHIIDHAEIQRRSKEARQRDATLIVHPQDVRKALPAPQPEEE